MADSFLELFSIIDNNIDQLHYLMRIFEIREVVFNAVQVF